MWRGLYTEVREDKDGHRGGPIVPKAVYYRVSVHKALQGLLREADVSLVPDEEGAASLVEVTDSRCRDHSMGSNVVEDDAPH
jgi:hypothetical protein